MGAEEVVATVGSPIVERGGGRGDSCGGSPMDFCCSIRAALAKTRKATRSSRWRALALAAAAIDHNPVHAPIIAHKIF